MIFEKSVEIHFRQTDMAGITYFAEVHNIFHDLYEDFVAEYLMDKKTWFNHPKWAVPIRKIDTEFFRPLIAFESYQGKIQVTHLGDHSFALSTELTSGDQCYCRLTTVHVFIDKKDQRMTPIPEDTRHKLLSIITSVEG